MSSPKAQPKNKGFDLINRGEKKASPIGTGLFVGLRTLDPLLQYGILAHGVGSSLLAKLGLEVLPAGLPINTGIALIDGLGLSPYRLILLTMAAGSSIKQIFWLTYTSEDSFPPSVALAVSIYNTVFNSVANLAFTTALFSASLSNSGRFPQPPLIVGAVLYTLGIFTEAVAEVQRKHFKSRPENKGKVCTTGLWSVTRHINYTGYSAWRSGYIFAAAGWTWGLGAGAFLVCDFAFRAIPALDEYCSNRYGQQWVEFKKKVPYQIVPGLW